MDHSVAYPIDVHNDFDKSS